MSGNGTVVVAFKLDGSGGTNERVRRSGRQCAWQNVRFYNNN